MDEPDPPSAAELGISTVAYERILRDLQRRRAGVPIGAYPRVPPATRRWRRGVGVALGVLVGVAVLPGLAAVHASHGGPAYAFMAEFGDRPVTYSSCRPIQVAVYPSGGPPDAEELVREAVSQLRADTGLDITVIGSFGGHAPNWNFKAAPVSAEDPISVSWQDQDTLDEMTDDVAGLGGSPIVRTADGGERYVAGAIALSRSYYAELSDRGRHDEALAVLLHEFGHVFGLAHVRSRHELMSEANVGQTHYGSGDLEGLRILGRGPCV